MIVSSYDTAQDCSPLGHFDLTLAGCRYPPDEARLPSLYGDGNRRGRCGLFGAIAVMSGNSVRSTEPRVDGGAPICYVENFRGFLSVHQGPEQVSSLAAHDHADARLLSLRVCV